MRQHFGSAALWSASVCGNCGLLALRLRLTAPGQRYRNHDVLNLVQRFHALLEWNLSVCLTIRTLVSYPKLFNRFALRLVWWSCTKSTVMNECILTNIGQLPRTVGSRDSSVSIATGCGLDSRRFGFRFPAGARGFSLLHSVQTSFGTYPASYTTGAGDSFPRGKAAAVWSWSLTSI
jgi:hypothetical protein